MLPVFNKSVARVVLWQGKPVPEQPVFVTDLYHLKMGRKKKKKVFSIRMDSCCFQLKSLPRDMGNFNPFEQKQPPLPEHFNPDPRLPPSLGSSAQPCSVTIQSWQGHPGQGSSSSASAQAEVPLPSQSCSKSSQEIAE